MSNNKKFNLISYNMSFKYHEPKCRNIIERNGKANYTNK